MARSQVFNGFKFLQLLVAIALLVMTILITVDVAKIYKMDTFKILNVTFTFSTTERTITTIMIAINYLNVLMSAVGN